MNKNIIVFDAFSNEESAKKYSNKWPDDSVCLKLYRDGRQCGGCSFFAPWDQDWGLCCHKKSEHFTETVFEHFTCGNYVNEGWGPHSFTEDVDCHCRCEGEGDWNDFTPVIPNA